MNRIIAYKSRERLAIQIDRQERDATDFYIGDWISDKDLQILRSVLNSSEKECGLCFEPRPDNPTGYVWEVKVRISYDLVQTIVEPIRARSLAEFFKGKLVE